MKIMYFLFFSLALVLSSCGSAENENYTKNEKNTTTPEFSTIDVFSQKEEIVFAIVNTDTLFIEYLTDDFYEFASQTIPMIYMEGAKYTVVGEYLFYSKKHKVGGLIRGQNLGEPPTVEEPDNMFAFATGEEKNGLPPANAKLIGKLFDITFDGNGFAIKIELAE